MIYNLLKRQIDRATKFTTKKAEELQEKLDVFLLMDRITEAEYKELTEKLASKTERAAQ